MLKTCEHCGASFEGAPQARFCSDAHRKAHARSRTKEQVGLGQAGQSVRVEGVVEADFTPGDSARRPGTLRGLIAAARRGEIVLSEREEQAVRNHFGYARSETRTLLERDAVAKRITGSSDRLVELPKVVVRYRMDGTPVEEPVGPAGLSLVAFPVQREGDLAPTAEQLAKLGR